MKSGNLKEAKSLLGRDFSISGLVTKGDGIGREMSFPTANIEDLESAAIPHGVYAVLADLGGESFKGVANLGVRPTVMSSNNSKPKLEVHLFDFDRPLYGCHMCVALVEYLRPEAKFKSNKALSAAMNDDSANARRILAEPDYAEDRFTA